LVPEPRNRTEDPAECVFFVAVVVAFDFDFLLLLLLFD